jgi:hypothetical protein
MEVANTLAYYDAATVTAKKCFILQPHLKPNYFADKDGLRRCQMKLLGLC